MTASPDLEIGRHAITCSWTRCDPPRVVERHTMRKGAVVRTELVTLDPCPVGFPMFPELRDALVAALPEWTVTVTCDPYDRQGGRNGQPYGYRYVVKLERGGHREWTWVDSRGLVPTDEFPDRLELRVAGIARRLAAQWSREQRTARRRVSS